MSRLLVVVDYQNDFVSGALGFAGAERLEPGILAAVQNTLDAGGFVLFTRDTHRKDYPATREGIFLPVPHCIARSAGHRLYGGLRRYETQRPPHTALLNKPGFGSPGIVRAAQRLCGGAPAEIALCGVVTDICVLTNALLLHTGFQDARIAILADLCGTGNTEGGRAALQILRGMGFDIA